MAKKVSKDKTNKARANRIAEKMQGKEITLEDVPLLTDEEVEAMDIVDLKPTKEFDYVQGQWNFKEAYRLMTLMTQWIMSEKDNCFSTEFYLFVVPEAVKQGKIKKFPGLFISGETISNMRERWPFINKMYKKIKEMQDFKVANKGFDGTWNCGLCQLYLKTHDREHWTEIQQIETTNKTQIINIDPLADDEK